MIACGTYSKIEILPEVHKQEKCGGKSCLHLKSQGYCMCDVPEKKGGLDNL